MPQSAPAQPARQWHAPLTHWPRPWQLRGQMRVAQSRPDQPSWQRHSPATRHVPWQLERLVGSRQLQSPGQTSSSHAGPPQPWWHAHTSGAAQSPWPEQCATLEQSDWLHDSPKWFSSHSHAKGAVHTP